MELYFLFTEELQNLDLDFDRRITSKELVNFVQEKLLQLAFDKGQPLDKRSLLLSYLNYWWVCELVRVRHQDKKEKFDQQDKKVKQKDQLFFILS